MWTEPKHIEKWWGPRGFETRVEEVDMRVGGRSRYVMTGPDGTEYPAEGMFIEVDPPNKIVSTDEFGEGFEDAHPDVDLPKGIVITIRFDDLGTRTRLTLTISHPNAEERKKHEEMGVIEGWSSSFDCMDDYLVELQK